MIANRREGELEMRIKWIVTDMDGTLLNSRNEISDRTRKALMDCQKKGIRLILASGRSYARLMPYVKELQLEEYGGSLIEINGLALNRLREKKRQVFAQLEQEDIDRLFPILEECRAEIQGYEDDAIYFWIPEWQLPLKEQERKEKGYPPDHPLVAGPWSWVTDNVHNYSKIQRIYSREELPHRLNKLNCTSDSEHMKKVYRELISRLAGQYEFVRTCPRLVEICPAGITKGKTLRRYMKMEGVAPEEVMVFGDGENDVDMFSSVKYSIAMGNAEDYVKESASYVTETNNEDGLVAALEKYRVI